MSAAPPTGGENDPGPGEIRARPRARTTLPFLAPLWALGLALGLFVLNDYASRPGAEATAPDDWPAGSSVEPAAGRPTVPMAVHPLCPCTRASVEELARLAVRIGDRAQIVVLFLDPADGDPAWAESDLWAGVRRIPGARSVRDVGGAEIERFGIETSGQVLVYDRGGALVFRGGITVSRGHAGDNAGRSAVEEWVIDGRSGTASTPVFGCELGRVAPAAGGEGTGTR